MVAGNLSSKVNFDQAFDNWKEERLKKEIDNFARVWGIDEGILYKSLDQFSMTKKDMIPYIDDITRSIDFKKASNKEAGNQLKHIMNLITEALPKWFIEMKQRYK